MDQHAEAQQQADTLPIQRWEFIALCAALMALNSLAIDGVLTGATPLAAGAPAAGPAVAGAPEQAPGVFTAPARVPPAGVPGDFAKGVLVGAALVALGVVLGRRRSG